MTVDTPPPRGLRWSASDSARWVAVVMAGVALLVSIYVGYRYVGLVDCLRAVDLADQRRTAAIAEVTDRERAAQRAIIEGTTTAAEREAAKRAYDETDRVRAAYPPPAGVACE